MTTLFRSIFIFHFFFFNDTATTEIYTLSLHDALPISVYESALTQPVPTASIDGRNNSKQPENLLEAPGSNNTTQLYFETSQIFLRSEEHTSELQSRQYLVCRLLLEKKK